jgi:hypothetical protein
VLGTGETRQVGADLGDQPLRRALANAGDALQQRARLVLSGQARFQLGVHAGDGRIQRREMRELLTQQEHMVGLQPANDRLGQRFPLGP